MTFPDVGAPQVVRSALPGIIVAGLWAFLAEHQLLPTVSVATGPIQTGVLVLFFGLALDLLGLYKLHPAYRQVRRTFFRELAKRQDAYGVKHQRALSSESEPIAVGELVREEVLYSQPEGRQSDLKLEQAFWISLINIHILVLIEAVAVLGEAAAAGSRGLPAATAFVVLVVVSAVSGVAGIHRLKSYNTKVLSLARRSRT